MESRRNIVPVMLDGFDFEEPSNESRLTGQLSALKDYKRCVSTQSISRRPWTGCAGTS